jgi:hypothetical protein
LFLEPFKTSQVLELVSFTSSIFKVFQVAKVIDGGLIQETVGVGITGGAEEEGVIVLEVVLIDLLEVENFLLLSVESLLLGETMRKFVLEIDLLFLI